MTFYAMTHVHVALATDYNSIRAKLSKRPHSTRLNTRGLSLRCAYSDPDSYHKSEADYNSLRRGVLGALAAAGFVCSTSRPTGSTFSAADKMLVANAATMIGEPVTDPRVLLRNALPVSLEGSPLVELDNQLRALAGGMSAKRSAAGSRSIVQSDTLLEGVAAVDAQALSVGLRKATSFANNKADQILEGIPPCNRPAAQRLLDQLTAGLSAFEQSAGRMNLQTLVHTQNDLLNVSGQLQSLMVEDVFVPEEYKNLPVLKGRAVVEITLYDDDRPGQENVVTVVLDGLNAPLTAGNFLDLVQKKFYNGMPVQRADGFVVQTGESAKISGRKIPMEVRFEGEQDITYGYTKDDLGFLRKQVVLPFNSQGTLAMARDEFDSNSADTQIFFLNRESEVTPSGTNVLDGNYAVFGYVVENQDAVSRLSVGDKIKSIDIKYGVDRFSASS
eukprot:CAMPEP_0114245588 /NCGR_PEP_ID=MMETSP0058-20121206/11982_1 /TAXON_ID=36894 /ORGANISM="Pyramimonas parkeae, CCMP726" /LENGTH=444 /DNA_ID=CAMNT_0001358663 /DNA_START=49 /DNA_END=1383 /DNA_ORIENTATION=+